MASTLPPRASQSSLKSASVRPGFDCDDVIAGAEGAFSPASDEPQATVKLAKRPAQAAATSARDGEGVGLRGAAGWSTQCGIASSVYTGLACASMLSWIISLGHSSLPSWSMRLLLVLVPLGLSACGDDEKRNDSCTPDDQDGVIGGQHTVLLTVSDTDFSVGAPGSGSTQRNITIQNSSEVTLTLTNVGTRPHGFSVACIPSELPAPCPQTSCFPPEAEIEPLEAGASTTVTFEVPAVEGAYPFTSDAAGDEALIGQFVLN